MTGADVRVASTGIADEATWHCKCGDEGLTGSLGGTLRAVQMHAVAKHQGSATVRLAGGTYSVPVEVPPGVTVASDR